MVGITRFEGRGYVIIFNIENNSTKPIWQIVQLDCNPYSTNHTIGGINYRTGVLGSIYFLFSFIT